MADQQYLIDISATMKGGDETNAQLQAMAAELTGMGPATAVLGSAVAHAQSALTSAGEAAKVAAEAVKAGQTAYDQLETSANRAARALEKAQLSGSKGNDAHVLARNAHLAAEALKAEGTALDALKAKSEAASAAQARAAASVKNLEAASKAASKAAAASAPSGKVNELAEAFGRIPGPVGRAGQQLFGFVDGLGKMRGAAGAGATGAVAVAAAIALVTIAAVAGVAALAKWAVSLADGKRNAALSIEALEQTSDSLAGLSGYIGDVSKATGLGGADLMDLAKQLDAAKVSADNMPAALQAAATAEAALGKGGAAKFIQELKDGKTSVNAFAKNMESKFGGIVADRLISLDKLSERFHKGLDAIFGGLNVDPLLQALSRLVDLFDASDNSGKAMKGLFETVFQPIVDGATVAFYAIEAFILGVEIAALKMAITFKPAIDSVRELFGGDEDSSLESSLESVATAGEYFGYVMVGVGAVVLGVVAAIATAVALMALPFVLAGAVASAALYLVIAGFTALVGAAADAFQWLSENNLAELGSDWIAGIAAGMLDSATAVYDAMTSIVGGAIDIAKDLIRPGSPSRTMKKLFRTVPQGAVAGIEEGHVDVRNALESMAAPPDVRDTGGKGGAARSGARVTINIQNMNGVKDPEDFVSRVNELLTRAFEGDAIELGGGEVPA